MKLGSLEQECFAILQRETFAPLPPDVMQHSLGSLTLLTAPTVRTVGGTGKTIRKAVMAAAAHRQLRLEAAMEAGTVLPLVPGQKANAEALIPHLPELHEWLNRLRNRVQFQFTVSWDHHNATRYFSEQVPCRNLRLSDPKASDLKDHNSLAQHLRLNMDQILDDLSCDSIVMPISGREMLLNRVLLLEAGNEGRLDQAAEEIDAIWPEGFRIRLVGPSPAVSFALASLRPVPLREVRHLAETLGLPLPWGNDQLTGASLHRLSGDLAQRRAGLLRTGANPAQVALLSRICSASWPSEIRGPLHLLDMRREGCADPVGPGSLPDALTLPDDRGMSA